MLPGGAQTWAPAALRVLRTAAGATSKLVRTKFVAAVRKVNGDLQPVLVRNTARQPIHPAALVRQSKRASGRWYSSSALANAQKAARRFLSSGASPSRRFDRSALPVSNTSRAVSQLTGRSPFSSTLRPNLTGGALPRTAGGYVMPSGAGRVGGARFFSHTPAAPAQVVQNVSQAVRAFWLSGQRARFDGYSADGKTRYRAVNAADEEARVRMATAARNAPGSFIDFRISPTVTALSPLAAVAAAGFSVDEATTKPEAAAVTLAADGVLDVLSEDFTRSLKDLMAVMADLKRLAVLGDLPVSMEKNNVIRVRFPGVDADTVERLCDDIGVERGIINQDEAFDISCGVPLALRFPFAPDAPSDGIKTMTSPGGSMRSHRSEVSSIEEDEAFFQEYERNPWMSSPESEGYESMEKMPQVYSRDSMVTSEDEYEGVEAIYRFLAECDRARDRGRF